MSDPPVGRVALTVSGFGLGRSVEGAKSEVCCGHCHAWFDGRERGCPECGWERPGFCEAIRVGQLNRHLYESAGLRPKSGDFRI